ncbi:MAG: cysteine hydrolase [Gammaproteobacteria bacterium]|jgi:nicotinamidase-related amidase|nr:cysteine hydrolase [Gammaproteobacteria bacterium]
MEFDLTNSRTALLVLDLQELFSSAEGPFKNTGADELIHNVNAFSKYCHDLELPVIYSRYLFRDDLSDAGLLIDNPVVQQGHFCESSEWMQLDKRLKLTESSINLQRNRPGAFWNGDLEQTLKQHEIDTLLLCGLSVNNAVSTTAREAFARDYPTVVIKECTGAAPWETELDSYFDTLNTWTAEVASMDDIKQRLDKNDY